MVVMLQKIRELICIGAKLDHFPKKDKEYHYCPVKEDK